MAHPVNGAQVKRKGNGATKYVRLGIGVGAFVAGIWLAWHWIGALLGMGALEGALILAGTVINAVFYLVKDIFASSRDEHVISVPGGYKVEIQATIREE